LNTLIICKRYLDIWKEKKNFFKKTVYSSEVIKALDASWHPKCLKCQVCQTRLSLTTLNSYEMMPYCRSHVPTVKHTTVAHDVMSQHAKESQKVASYSRSENITTQKGTGEKPTQNSDDQSMQHAKAAQQVSSYAKRENIETQKGTGEKPTQSSDDQSMQHAKAAQEVASYAKKENIETQKGTGEKPTDYADA